MEVRLEAINKTFGSNHVVRDVDLTFPDRHFVTLLGPSGCGKTTLLRMVAGLESVTSGTIYFGSRRINELRPAERNVAMVFQSYALYPNMTVAANIGYSLRVRGVAKDRIREKVGEVARILEISHLLDRRPRQLSGGQRQRVALGRAMVRDPSVFLMDEPLSNLDAQLRTTMRSELRRFHRNLRATTVYVTHDQLEAMTMSDVIAVMRDGSVQQFDTPQNVYRNPANIFVAQFIGSPPMNFQDVRLSRDSGGRLQLPNGGIAIPARVRDRLARSPEGEGLVMGIRPQDLKLTSTADPRAIPGQVQLVEMVGSEKLVEVSDGANTIRVEVAADFDIVEGQNAGLIYDPDRVHLFNTADGIAVA
jgi:ABC-type sugar transport system ATPase subunit